VNAESATSVFTLSVMADEQPPLDCSTSACVLTASQRSGLTAQRQLSHEQAAAAWQSCSSLSQLCHLQRHYFLSHLPFTVTYHGSLHSETLCLLPFLHPLCDCLLLSTFSQPAVLAAELNTFYVKPDCPQRAALCALTSADSVARLRLHHRTHSDSRIHICLTPPPLSALTSDSHAAFHCLHPLAAACAVPVSMVPRDPARLTVRQRLSLPAVSGGEGESDSAAEGGGYYGVSSVGGGATYLNRQLEACRAALNAGMRRWVEQEAWQLWAVDLQWGRKEALWLWLLQAFS
jgi:hypothetical protein